MYTSVVLPFKLAFNVSLPINNPWEIISLAIDFFFVIDILCAAFVFDMYELTGSFGITRSGHVSVLAVVVHPNGLRCEQAKLLDRLLH